MSSRAAALQSYFRETQKGILTHRTSTGHTVSSKEPKISCNAYILKLLLLM